MTEIIMPKAGMSMETGRVVRWLVKEGDSVKAGDAILEIETDKVNMEVESFGTGTVLKLLANEGDVLPVTNVIGYIGEPGETIPSQKTDNKNVTAQQVNRLSNITKTNRPALYSSQKIPATPLAKTLCRQRGIHLADVKPSGALGEVKAADVPEHTFKATPLAKQIAKANNVDIKSINAGGRVYAKDIKSAAQSIKNTQIKRPAMMDGDKTQVLSSMRKIIAKRMYESHNEIPPVTLHTKADVTGLLAKRQNINASGEEKISINDFIIEACAQTLKKTPEANASFDADAIIKRSHINIGVAVAADDGGLFVPVIKDTDHLSLEDISAQMKQLARKARQGGLIPDDYSGGTFTISNLGMFGITFFTPIINQPESMILGVNAIEKVLKMKDGGALYNRDMMGLSLTFDHRVHDGASAARFLKNLVQTLERFNKHEVGK